MIQRLLGALLSSAAIGYVAWGLSMGNPDKSPVGPLIFAALLLGGGISLIAAGRKPKLAAPKVTLEQQITALARNGRITAAEIAADSAYSYEEVQGELERLAGIGRCDMQVTEEGLCVFDFSPDAQSEQAESRSVPNQSVPNQNVIGSVRGRD